jgi:uncharacterized membrane protein YgcG
MDILKRITSTKRKIFHWALSMAATGLLLATVNAFADDPVTMAPPVNGDTQWAAGAPDNASADTVFNWTEVPANQEVPIRHAAFDQGGYQLYDTVGETIIVPFKDQNLYVMKFAQSNNGTMYFVNTGDYPVLYVPKNGYLENATVPGGRWYPFSEDFHPAEPVFLGVAPSWSAFISMGWYPNMVCYGGYWSHTSFIAGGVFLPAVGLFFEIGGHPYYGWDAYHRYFLAHPAPYRLTYVHHDVYRWADRPRESLHRFMGAGHEYYAHRAFNGGRSFDGGRTFRGARDSGDSGRSSGNDRSFHGGDGGDRSYGGGDRGGYDGGRHFRG